MRNESVSAFAAGKDRSRRDSSPHCQDAAQIADRFISEFFDLFHLLAKNPEIGQQRVELRPNLRSISHGSYVVFFYPMAGGVEIAGVVHGARDIDALFRTEQR